ncbi:S-layer homology domain-containing protein [Desulfotomaculum nigrificans]|uniref:S-layer homology domain-containing protein n=1 Tax=Desulfotomaculum nigrificans TaxID=1565 RepID=UPI0001FADF3A|nr:S-layer homology domain-containing protein [Desulfotomaculum nigrificans]
MRKAGKLFIMLFSVIMLTTLLVSSAWADPWKKTQVQTKGWQKHQNQLTVTYHFKDIQNHWARNEIQNLYAKGVMKGYEQQLFKPNSSVSKNEALATIMRIVDHQQVNINSDKKKLLQRIFPAWMGLAPIQAYDSGILADWELINWNGNQPATRIEVAMWLSRAAGDKEVSVKELLSFKDIKQLSKDELVYAAIMYNRGIMRGTPDGYLNPFKPISRGEFAVMICRFMDSETGNYHDENGQESPDLVEQLTPANGAKVATDTKEFKINFSADMVLADGKDMGDLAEAVKILKYQDGRWVDAGLEFALVFNENNDQLVVKLDNNENLAADTKYCITVDDGILVADTSKEEPFDGIAKGQWSFTAE